jgi:hypothetical protein
MENLRKTAGLSLVGRAANAWQPAPGAPCEPEEITSSRDPNWSLDGRASLQLLKKLRKLRKLNDVGRFFNFPRFATLRKLDVLEKASQWKSVARRVSEGRVMTDYRLKIGLYGNCERRFPRSRVGLPKHAVAFHRRDLTFR